MPNANLKDIQYAIKDSMENSTYDSNKQELEECDVICSLLAERRNI